MAILITLAGILLLVILIGYFKIDTFISFILSCIVIGFGLGLSPDTVANAIQDGIGSTLGFLVVILGCGAMLGKLVADSGAAQSIAYKLTSSFPSKYIQWAVVLAGFIVGIPMFYSVGFVILVPLVFTLGAATRLPLLYIGLPMLAALSVTHGYLPPHPAPTALVESYNADFGTTMLYGLIVAIPAIIVGGPLFARRLKHYNPKPLQSLVGQLDTKAELPNFWISVLVALSPVLLIGLGTLGTSFSAPGPFFVSLFETMANPLMAMIFSVLIAMYFLGYRIGRTTKQISASLLASAKDIAMILLIIAGAGALKEILVVSMVSDQIGAMLQNIDAEPLILAWGIAAIIRVCVGSATVAGLTSAGIVAPLISLTGADPNLMVLATGAGSLMFSHVNDTGFWLFKEFFNLSITDTLKTWSVMETIVSIAGLIGVLIINAFL